MSVCLWITYSWRYFTYFLASCIFRILVVISRSLISLRFDFFLEDFLLGGGVCSHQEVCKVWVVSLLVRLPAVDEYCLALLLS